MKYILLIIVFSNILLFSQAGKKEKLEWVKSRGDVKITEEDKDIYRFEYEGGRVTYKYLGEPKRMQDDTVPTTVIDTWNVDTTLYQHLYTFWQEVLISTHSAYELIIGDANKNGYPEIYGYSRDYDDLPDRPVSIFEMDSAGIFVNRYTFPDSVRTARGLYDISGNGELNLLARGSPSSLIQFYTSDEQTLLPTELDFILNDYSGQLNNPKFGDFDKNGITDFLFYDFSPRRTVICEYDESVNNFATVFEIPHIGYHSGYAIGDFDIDGKTDIVYGNLMGEVFVIEAEKEHSYSVVWQTELEGYHTYMQMFTNDIDKNGKPEFWVSSTTHNGIMDITRFSCFEYKSDNEYKEVYRIDFLGMFPFYASNIFPLDVDKDGTEELVICLDDHLFILKFKGTPGNHFYEIFYMIRNNLPYGAYFGATMNDLTGNGYEELLIHQAIGRDDGRGKHCTFIYKPDFVVSVNNEEDHLISVYSLEQNYPNPFNNLTVIKYSVSEEVIIQIKIYDLLGREIKTVLNEEILPGIYETVFDASGLSSGVYVYRITALRNDRLLFSQSKQMILLK